MNGKLTSVEGYNSRPLLYDVYCCAGGCSVGYYRAGFRVVGIDNKPQKHYPFEFLQMDALEFLDRYIAGEFERASAFHASPPCQAHTMASNQWRTAGKEYPELIAPTRERLIKIGLPYVIENVPGAPLISPVKLNGAMFGLRLRRNRLFETSFEIPFFLLPKEEASHPKMGRPVNEGDIITPVGHFPNVPYARRVMGIDWGMCQGELAQAIPPAYTNFIGKYLLAAVQKE